MRAPWFNKRNTMLLALATILFVVILANLLGAVEPIKHLRQGILFTVMATIILLQGWCFGHRYEQLYRVSITDPLTQLYNKRYLAEVASQQLLLAKEAEVPLSVAILDVDDFKQYNDSYGHLAGDDVLEQLGETLRNNVREQDVVARFGGDEFVLLFPFTDLQQAMKIMQRIRGTLLSSVDAVTFSSGIATFPVDGETFEDLLRKADQNMYHYKSISANFPSYKAASVSSRFDG